MKLITQRDLILGVAKRFEEQYGKKSAEVHRFGSCGTLGNAIKRLHALDRDKASPKDVSDIIGNDSWTSITCDECGTRTDAVVQVGQEPDYESATANLCKTCLHKAALML